MIQWREDEPMRPRKDEPIRRGLVSTRDGVCNMMPWCGNGIEYYIYLPARHVYRNACPDGRSIDKITVQRSATPPIWEYSPVFDAPCPRPCSGASPRRDNGLSGSWPHPGGWNLTAQTSPSSAESPCGSWRVGMEQRRTTSGCGCRYGSMACTVYGNQDRAGPTFKAAYRWHRSVLASDMRLEDGARQAGTLTRRFVLCACYSHPLSTSLSTPYLSMDAYPRTP